MASEHRQAMLDAWQVITQRNTDLAFDQALQRQPKLGADDALAWRFGMVEYYQAPLDRAMKATKKGRASFAEPLRSQDNRISWIPPNGAAVLAPQLFNWLLVQQDIEDPESILINLPLVIATLEDWFEGEDTFFILFEEKLVQGLLQLASESPGPNLGPALQACPSPFLLSRDRFSKRRHLFLFHGQQPQTRIAQITDLSLPDPQVLKDCTEVLTDVYQQKLKNSIYLAPTLEEWLESLPKAAEKDRDYLISIGGMDPVQVAAMHPYRATLLASIAQFDAFARRHEELLTLPIHEAVALWLQESEPASQPNVRDEWKPLGALARDFYIFYADEHWNSHQGISAVAIVYALRDYLAKHGTLPATLQELPPEISCIDPITNQPFLYERTSPQQATLQLSHYRQGVRQIWKLESRARQE